jgi:pentatricopeptide repeat protein
MTKPLESTTFLLHFLMASHKSVILDIGPHHIFPSHEQVYDWMTERRDRFSLSSSDMAIQLDLIAKVRGVSHAEKYFDELPDAMKDKRTYGSLLNVYAQAMMKEKTEDTFEQMRKKDLHLIHYLVMC